MSDTIFPTSFSIIMHLCWLYSIRFGFFFLILEHVEHIPVLRCLHLLFSFPGIIYLWITTWLASSLSSGVCLNFTPLLTTWGKIVSFCTLSLYATLFFSRVLITIWHIIFLLCLYNSCVFFPLHLNANTNRIGTVSIIFSIDCYNPCTSQYTFCWTNKCTVFFRL